MPGVGKTTYARKLEIKTGARRFSLDEMVDEHYGDKHECDLGIREYAVKYQYLEEIEEALRKGDSVILDYGFFKNKERQRYRLLAKDYGTSSEIHFVTTDYDTQLGRVLERNKELDNIHHIDKELLDFLITLFEVPTDDDLITIET